MSKKQIRLTQEGIQKLIQEAIQDKLNGVFSTDDPKSAEAVRNDLDDYDAYYGEDWRDRKNRETLADLIDKRANGEEAQLDRPNAYSRFALEDEFGDSKEESERYDKPFGDLDDIENQWTDEPGYEEKSEGDDDDNIAGLSEGKVTLSEEGLRKFVSYSVAKLLKEGNLGTTVHFGGDSSFKPENPYKDMSWDEYCEAKRKEHEKEAEGRSERDEHLFDDQYWVDKMNLSKDDLQEMVRRTLNEVLGGIGQEDPFITKLNAAMGAIQEQMSDIEQRYEEAEEDPNQLDYYRELQQAYETLESLINNY